MRDFETEMDICDALDLLAQYLPQRSGYRLVADWLPESGRYRLALVGLGHVVATGETLEDAVIALGATVAH